jgi:hypothetical protein
MCNGTFVAARERALRAREAPTKKEKAGNEKKAPLLLKWSHRTADAAVMLDGALGGTIGGILVGLLVGSIAGANKSATAQDPGAAVGGFLTGLFYGFMIGFGMGTFIGLSLGLFSKLINYLFEFKSKRACVASGTLTGAAVAALLGDQRWALIGAVVGGVGAILWSLINGWAESYMPPAPSKKLQEDLEDDLAPRRHVIDQSAGDYPKGMSGLNPRYR